MRENEKEREELKASYPKTLLMERRVLVTLLVWGFYSQTPFTKYQKRPKEKSITRDKLGRKKFTKKVKTSKSRKGEQW